MPKNSRKQELLVIGVGNRFRSDDAAGLLVAESVGEKKLPGVRVIGQSGEGAGLMDAWGGFDSVILVDATSSGAAAGTIHRFDAASSPIPSKFFNYSTHAFSVAEAVELARTLGRLPAKFIVYGIEGENFSAGTAISEKILRSSKLVVKRVLDDIAAMKMRTRSRTASGR